MSGWEFVVMLYFGLNVCEFLIMLDFRLNNILGVRGHVSI